jgi:serine/threonine protein phosphatase 1
MIYAIGDIHGHYWKLVGLLSKMPLTPDDQLIFVGDYIDRGPQSREVIELLIDLRKQRPGTVFLRGNHEQMILDARAYRHDFAQTALWMSNGGAQTVDSYPKAKGGWIERLPDEHWDFIGSTEVEFEMGPYRFVHAGLLPPDKRWPYVEDPRLWIREEFLNSKHDFGSTVVFGHTPQKSGKPLLLPGKIGIDTAAAFGGPLTGVKLSPEGDVEPEFFQS